MEACSPGKWRDHEGSDQFLIETCFRGEDHGPNRPSALPLIPFPAPARPFAPPHRGLPIPTARRTAEKLKADGVHERCQPFSMSFGQHSKDRSKMPTMKIVVKTWREEGIAAGASASHDASLHDADTTGIKRKKMKDLNVGRSYRPTVWFPFRLAVINGT
jgi:hypothetical protein